MKKDGGSAFPSETLSHYQDNAGNMTPVFETKGGLSIRDYFAGQALAGLCAKEVWNDGEECVLASWSYALADAMLEEREKEKWGAELNVLTGILPYASQQNRGRYARSIC